MEDTSRTVAPLLFEVIGFKFPLYNTWYVDIV